MKKYFLRNLKSLIDWLQKIHNYLLKENKPELPYVSLSPIDNADISEDYKKSLDWALNNRKKYDIKNIALAGPYGSGKSSILKTYIKDYKGNDLHFLPISLATFKEEEEESKLEGGVQKPREDLLRLIELSILQQIFYFEEDRKIPDSRFRKIKNYTKNRLFITTIAVFLLILAVLDIVYPQLYPQLLDISWGLKTIKYLRYFSLLIIISALLIIIFRSIRIINGIKINKLNLQNAEISINENVNKSILNSHLDEILYFLKLHLTMS